ncbi:LTA synthase family protein [Spirochaeta lutea]|uniref:Sulfatase N-terminal domain-containing protein n=1 Tax=Spirochaeta lutea TaxID=1480694 RepID=A0A098QU68_9SPIO|nr:sulfatase-like hydrolase/transferase [Spirochaeta lutea]KGE71269.1 hypothetical protein DC28_12580 [Spirochaeta lutea]
MNRVSLALVSWIHHRPIRISFGLSLFLTLFIECINQQSWLGGLSSMVEKPLIFFINVGIIFLTMSIGLLFSKRVFVLSVITVLWASLGIVNGILLALRSSPLLATDFLLLRTTFDIALVYYTPLHIALLGITVGGILIALGFAFRRSRNIPVPYLRILVAAAVGGVFVIAGGSRGIEASQITRDGEESVSDLYREQGFVLGFSQNLIQRGIDRPQDYSEEAVWRVLEEISHSTPPRIPSEKPDIIFLQLESFFVPQRIKGAEFSEDPIPTFRKLMADFPSGYLSVPVIGGGTVNTEFEVLTGLPLSLFAPGEYPYNSTLRDRSLPSLAADLAGVGYTSYALHNHTGNFYDRNVVYEHLGFDGFISMEYMQNLSFNEHDWARDESLFPEIMDILDHSSGPDFIFGVSVQAHGKYPEPWQSPAGGISVTRFPEDLSRDGFEYFVNELRDIDGFISRLTRALENRPNPVILVLYGDHLPGMGITDAHLTDGNDHHTEYIIWSNHPDLVSREQMPHPNSLPEDSDPGDPRSDPMDSRNGLKHPTLAAYELGARALGYGGLRLGIVPRIHHRYAGHEELFPTLQLVGYSLLNGHAQPTWSTPAARSTPRGQTGPDGNPGPVPRAGGFPGQESPLGLTSMNTAPAGEVISPREPAGYSRNSGNFRMGLGRIRIRNTGMDDDTVYIRGEGFTEFSTVLVDGNPRETVFLSSELLAIQRRNLRPSQEIRVAQISRMRAVLGTTRAVRLGGYGIGP